MGIEADEKQPTTVGAEPLTPMLKMAMPLPPPPLRRFRESITSMLARAVPARLRRRASGRRARGVTHPRRRKALVSLATLLLVVAVLAPQLNGAFGAWLADELRALLGPSATAQIESWFLGVEDGIHKVAYSVTGGSSAPPWTPPPPNTSAVPVALPPQVQEMPLPPITPVITPPLDGEGVWSTAGLPAPSADQPPLAARAFVRPDPSRPYAVATMLQFDLRYLTLHVVAGTSEPGGPLGNDGPGVIPEGVQQSGQLFAAFNGGFKYSDGHYGLMADGKVYVPPQNGAATIAITNKGQVLLDAWGRNPALSLSNKNLVAWRQNAALLIDNGHLNPLTNDGAAWGGVWLNKAATWRSALGLTANGTLIYAAGDSLTAATLGKALQAAGAVMAMQTDINPEWVRAFLYQRDASGAWQIIKLHPGMQGTGKEYLQHDDRDFFYVTRTFPGSPRSGQ